VDCQSNLRRFYESRAWQVFENKFRVFDYIPPSDLFECKICDDPIDGYFNPKNRRILLCANNMVGKTFDFTVMHELVHLYDDLRADFDYTNVEQVACGEIRAVHLSGECK
jgi:hypothetical protein